MRTHTLVSLVGLSLVLSLTACGEKKEFGASVPETSSKRVVESPVEPPAEPKPVIPDAEKPIEPKLPDCDPGQVGVTQVKLLSTGILTKTAKQTIRYELQMLSCQDGSVIPIRDQVISFDLNAIASNGFADIKYSVLNAADKSSIARGTLEIIKGSDLFGNSGAFAHWETESLNYKTDVQKMILEIKLEKNKFTPRDAGAKQIDSYLKIGDTKAVKQGLGIID